MLVQIGPHYVALDRLVWAEFVPAADRRPDQLRLHFDVDRFPATVLEGGAIAEFRRLADRYAGGWAADAVGAGPADPDVPPVEHLRPLTEAELAGLGRDVTPGPWLADLIDGGPVVRTDDDRLYGRYLVVAECDMGGVPARTQEANGALMAAAPRLLADVRRLRASNAKVVVENDSLRKLLRSAQAAPPPR